jgi:hypothetical protein
MSSEVPMRLFIIILLFTASVCQAYDIVPYSNTDSMQISSSGSYTLYGSVTIASPGISAAGNYTLNSGFLHSETGCTVKLRDLENVAQAWLVSGSSPADLNADSNVNILDYTIFAKYWLADCPPGWSLK